MSQRLAQRGIGQRYGWQEFGFCRPLALLLVVFDLGLFGRKVEYLNGLGRAALAGRLDTDRLRALSREDSLAELRQLAGIGEFGSQLVRLPERLRRQAEQYAYVADGLRDVPDILLRQPVAHGALLPTFHQTREAREICVQDGGEPAATGRHR